MEKEKQQGELTKRQMTWQSEIMNWWRMRQGVTTKMGIEMMWTMWLEETTRKTNLKKLRTIKTRMMMWMTWQGETTKKETKKGMLWALWQGEMSMMKRSKIEMKSKAETTKTTRGKGILEAQNEASCVQAMMRCLEGWRAFGVFAVMEEE
jgi:hypothetical protein